MNTVAKIVIWGADNYNTLGLIRSLKDDRFDVLLLINGEKHGVASASKYCKKYVVTGSVSEGVKYLIENYPVQENVLDRAVLIPGGRLLFFRMRQKLRPALSTFSSDVHHRSKSIDSGNRQE